MAGKKLRGLKFQNNSWWARKVIPADARHGFSGGELWENTHTANPHDAARLAQPYFDLWDRQIAAVRAGRSLGETSVEDARQALAARKTSWAKPSPGLTLPASEAHRLLLLERAASTADGWAAIPDFDELVAKLISSNRRVHPAEPVVERMRQEVAQHLVEQARLNPLSKAARKILAEEGQSSSGQPYGGEKTLDSVVVTLGKLIDSYRKERERKYSIESTARKYDHIFRALRSVIGEERDIRSITRSDCRSVRDLLERIPAHMGKRYPRLDMAAAIEAAERDGVPKIAPGTVKTYIQNLSAIFRWACEERLLEHNPTSGLIERARPNVKRRGFTADELGTLFASLALQREATPWRFWIPAISAFSGARANELCQLRVSEFVEVHGIACIDLTEFDRDGVRIEGARLKTDASARLLPLHPELVDAGILDLVEAARARGRERLFQELRMAKSGLYSHDLSKWFGRHLNQIGLNAPSLVFHSFRHGFRDRCREAGIDSETAEALGGWKTKGQASKYGDRGMVKVLYRSLKKVQYDEFRLTQFAKGERD